MKRLFLLSLLALSSCGPKPAPLAGGSIGTPFPRPAVIDEALAKIEDPLAGASKARVAVRLVRAPARIEGDHGEVVIQEKATADWEGWLPFDRRVTISEDGEDGLGELQIVVDLIRARALAEELVLARPYSWKKQSGDAWRGTLDAGGFVSVRLDDRKRITFVRTDAPGRPHALDLRYEGKSGWVHEMDVHDEGLEIGMRWTRRDAGLFDLDLAAAAGNAGGSIHVRVLEIARP